MKNLYLKIKPVLIKNFIDSTLGHYSLNAFLLTLVLILLLAFTFSVNAQTPVGVNGKLSVSGTKLVNKNGVAIQLRGMSSHGLQWYTEDYNFNSLSVLANNWGIDVFRLAMYPTDKPDATKNAYEGNPTFWKGYIDNLVDICGNLGIYCIIDWHVLTPGDPTDPTYFPMAKDFWDYMSKKHAGKEHVMYEICNEPNGVTWPTVKSYANAIIPIIRANDPSSIILVGSPTWSSDVDIAATDPIKDPNDPSKLASNVMYSFHFYAATHGQNYRDKITTAISKGLAIFVDEWGSTSASGDGASNWIETQNWIDFMATNKLSWCNWSYCDKNETSATLVYGTGAYKQWNNTSAQGDKLKAYIATPADSWVSSGNWKPAANIASPLNGEYFLPNSTVTLKADAVDKDGTIASVDFLVDGVKIGSAIAAPYTFNWTPASAKDYIITAVAKDNTGASGTSVPVTCHVVTSITQTAYPSGTPWAIPGDISCINFDNGGELITYHDIDAVHKGPGSGNARQTEGVDVEGTANIGYVLSDEWLEYTVNVATSGTYDFTLQSASGFTSSGSGAIHLESNGIPITAVVDVPFSGSWGSYQPTVIKNVPLNAGKQVIRLHIDRGNINISTMNFKFTGGVTYTITSSAGTGGSISPNGAVIVSGGADQTFTVTPATGNKITDVKVDGVSVGAVSSYTFTNVTANHTIAASFGPALTYTITASAGTGGSIAPSGISQVFEGSTFTYQITPAAGYKISDVKVDGVSKGAVPSYAFTNINANHTIVASFTALATYTITATAGAGGTITPSGTVAVTEGTNQTFTIQATPGYKVVDVKADGVTVGAVTSYTFTNVTANHTIDVTFDVTTCDLLSLYGAPLTTALPSINGNFKYVYVLGNHAAITNISTFTINWDLSNNGLYQFSINTNNGIPNWYLDLRPSMTYKFNGASPSIKITGTGSGLDGDYYVALDNGNFVMIDKFANYAIYFSNSTTQPQDCNVTNYTITASAGTGGTITPNGAVSVSKGSNKTFAIAASAGYKISAVTVDGVSQGAITSYTFTNVTANHTISASFVATPTYTITASAGTGGTITPSGAVNVASGANQSFAIAASAGYKISSVTVDGTSVGAVATYTFTNVTANHTISATFVATPTYTITASAGANGSITPSGAVTVAQGGNQSFAIAASAGYKINDVTVDGTSVGAVATYSFTNVTANHTIAASFVLDSNPCDLLVKYSVPRATALPTLANKSYTKAFTLGTGGPTLSNVTNFTINWDLPNKGLWQFSFNTNNGIPSWWLDMLPKITQSFGNASPACKLTGTGIAGLDGDYWANVDGANFVLVAKTGAYAIYFTNGTAPTGCPVKSAMMASDNENSESSKFDLFPTLIESNGSLTLRVTNIASNANYFITDLNGKTIISGTLKSSSNSILLNGKLKTGFYLVRINNGSELLTQKLIVK